MKLFNYALLLVSALGAASLNAAAPACGTDRTTLVVGTQFGVPPYESLTTTTPLGATGFDIAIACELRKRLGYQNLSIRAINPTEAANLASGIVNLIISPLNEINPTTRVNVAQVKYADHGFGFLFSGTTLPDGITATTVFDNLTGPVGALENSFEGNILAAAGIAATPFDDVASAVLAVKAGTITAFFSNNVVVNTVVTADPTTVALNDAVLPADDAFNPFRTTGIGIGVSPTCCQLYVNVRQAIADMVADGTYAARARENGVPTTFSAGADITPAGCATTTPRLVVRDPLVSFIFDKYCTCTPSVVTTIIPVSPID